MENRISTSNKETLDSYGIFLLIGEIDEAICKEIIKFILLHNLNPKPLSQLQIFINSDGGHLCDAFSIIDVMRGSKIPVHTIGIGSIVSAGLMIFMAGAKGKRILTPNTSILSHQFSSNISGKQHELFSTVKEFNLIRGKMLNHYKICTGLSTKIILEKLLPSEDVWLSASEAQKYKICDKIQEV